MFTYKKNIPESNVLEQMFLRSHGERIFIERIFLLGIGISLRDYVMKNYDQKFKLIDELDILSQAYISER